MEEKQYGEAAVERAMKVQEVITNHLVGGRRDSGHPRPDDETLARADETRRLYGTV